jgi:hypothetical protein
MGLVGADTWRGTMGYDLHITRKKNWDGWEDEHGPEISFDEWTAVVNADSELRIEGYEDRRLPDKSIVRQPLAAWTAYSRYRADYPGPALGLSHGNVTARNPDREFRCKMWRLAQALNAKVQGDDGEFYDCFGNPTPRAWTTQSYWLALVRHFGFRLVWGNPVGS